MFAGTLGNSAKELLNDYAWGSGWKMDDISSWQLIDAAHRAEGGIHHVPAKYASSSSTSCLSDSCHVRSVLGLLEARYIQLALRPPAKVFDSQLRIWQRTSLQTGAQLVPMHKFHVVHYCKIKISNGWTGD